MFKDVYEILVLTYKALKAYVKKAKSDFDRGRRGERALNTWGSMECINTKIPPTYDEITDYYDKYVLRFIRNAADEWSTEEIMEFDKFREKAEAKDGWNFLMWSGSDYTFSMATSSSYPKPGVKLNIKI